MKKKGKIFRKIISAVLMAAMLVTLLPTNISNVQAASYVKLQIKYGDTLIQITEGEWEDLLSAFGETVQYSIQPRDPNPPLIEEHTGVSLVNILSVYDINAAELTGTAKIILRSDLNEEMKKLSINDVFQTKRYSYQINEAGTGFVEESGVEVPVLINTDGSMCFGQKDTSEYNNQYNWNGLFNAEDNQFVSIEIPLSGTNETPKENDARPECDYALAADSFASGTGTEADPYIISNAAELWYLSKEVNSGETFEGKYLKLSADIDLKRQEWMPIGGDKVLDDGTATYKFMGTFDGNGKTIKNLLLNTSYNFTALFGYSGGTLKNFTVEGSVTCTGDYDYVSAVVGFNAGTISGVISKAEITATNCYNTGGIAGINVAGKWDQFTDSSDTKVNRTLEGAVGLITECGNEGNITACRSSGGIAGANHGTIDSCYNYGDIDIKWNGSMSKNGGIAGTCGNTGKEWGVGHIRNCYNTGDISWSGVAAARGYGGISCFISESSTVTNCYSIGSLKQGYDDFTPIVPRFDLSKYLVNNYSLDTIKCHYDYFTQGEVPSEIFKVATSGYRKTEAELKSSDFLSEIGATYATDTYNVNNGYPVLKWQNDIDLVIKNLECDTTELDVMEGETFDVEAIKIYAVYEDGTREYISSNHYTISKTDAFTKDDDGMVVTVTCEASGVKATFDIKINIVGKTLNKIAVWGVPTKYVYTEGESFNSDGMIVRAYFVNDSDGTDNTFYVEDYTCTTNGALSKENTTVTVSYTVKGVTKTDSFDVVVLDAVKEPEKSQNDIYQIKTADDLVWFANQVSYYGNTEISAKLINDIDVSGTDFAPIGQDTSRVMKTASGSSLTYRWNNAFSGVLDGNGKTVTLNLEGNGYQALIGFASGAEVKDITIKGHINSTGKYAAGIVANGSADISNCVNNASVTSSSSYAGGITGFVEGTVTDCKNTGTITATSYVGGIAGGNITKAVNCGNEGNVTATEAYAGGITGWGDEYAEIIGCYNIGEIQGAKSVGGIFGAGYVVKVENCYNKGNVTSTSTATTEGVGGIAGTKHKNYTLVIKNCYNAGTVAAGGSEAAKGELIGYAAHRNTDGAETTITNSYYLQKSTETQNSVGGASNEIYLKDSSKAKTLADLSKGTLLGDAYQDSCGGAVFTTQEAKEHSWETKDLGSAIRYTCTAAECGYSYTKSNADLVNPFTDVKESDYYYESVLWAVANNITTGTSATTFSPKDECTRAQVVTFLWRANGEPEPTMTVNPFTDVKKEDYYYKAVLWAVANNITTGTSATTFSPKDECTRAQVVTFLWRANGSPESTMTVNPFTDVKKEDYYYDAVLWAVENNITTGTSATTFGPKDTCIRAQVVTFLYRAQ